MNMQEERTNVPKIRFKGYAEEWEERKLGDGMYIKSRIGWQRLTKDEQLPKGDYYLITGTDINELTHTIDFDKSVYVSKERYDKDQNIQLKNGDIIVTKDGTIGKVAMVKGLDKPATLNSHLFVVRDLSAKVNNRFLLHILDSPLFKRFVDATKTGSTLTGLPQKTFVNFTYYLPTMAEQNNISSFLDTLDYTIALHQRKLDLLKQTKKSYLQKMFPKKGEDKPEIRFAGFTDAWEERKLGDLGSVAMNKRIFKDQTSDNGEVPFFKIGTFGSYPDAFISRELFEEYKAKYPYPEVGDILISASGSIGRTVVYQGEDEYFQDSNIVWLKHNGRLDNKFLQQFYSIVKWQGLEGSTIKRLYNKNILDTNISVPTLDEQNKLGAFFEQLDDTIALHQHELDSLKEMKKSLLQQMFV
ncbi:restriction endonuclease subunit S [Enterococcus faecium]|uniref:restriction endonuclease subunit S n=1 Tax=Enterococcus TaxID=1350 RepID=UPI0035CCA519